jgi:hypothetical protein
MNSQEEFSINTYHISVFSFRCLLAHHGTFVAPKMAEMGRNASTVEERNAVTEICLYKELINRAVDMKPVKTHAQRYKIVKHIFGNVEYSEMYTQFRSSFTYVPFALNA